MSIFLLQACFQDQLSDAADKQIVFPQQLSDFNIYKDNPIDLIPNADYEIYLLGSTLFTDYADKQRLIKLPAGTHIEKIDNGLPTFPDGTIIVKTFFYYNDKRDHSKGKRILETRLLIKENESWYVATYLWNEGQTDATLIEDGINTTVNYIDKTGQPKVIAYHVPSNRECATCHLNDNKLSPLGPKLRNMNIDVVTPDGTMNQISYLQEKGLILNDFDHTDISTTPDFADLSLPLATRGRAYFDANCGHCHNSAGFAANEIDLQLDYEVSLEDSNIIKHKEKISEQLNEGKMPFLGTSVLDEEGMEIIKAYINSL